MANFSHYVYWGRQDYPEPFMKVGITVHPDSRIVDVGIALEVLAGCLSRQDAKLVEATTRKYIKRLGGANREWRKDWFLYDEEIYLQVTQKLSSGEIHSLAGVEFVQTGHMDNLERAAYILKIRDLEEQVIQLRIRLGETPVVVDNKIAKLIWDDKRRGV